MTVISKISSNAESYYIGDWLIEPRLHRLSRNGQIKRIEPQLMAVLQQLASRPNQVMTKEKLMETVWSGVIVTENVLTRAISSLRKELEDDRHNPKYIETISKTGYRLIAAVKGAEQPKDDRSFTIKLRKRPVILLSGITLLIVLGAFATRGLQPKPSQKAYQPSAIANYSNTEYWPAISPDGRFVAYAWKGESNDNWDIYAKLIGTENTIRITDNPATDLKAEWSEDGNYIYYLRYEDGGSTIYKKSILGEEEVRVLKSPQYSFGDFDVSPDEKWVSFNGREDQSSPLRIKLISLETGEEKWLTAPEMGFNGDFHPTFSPNGNQLAFVREKNSVSMHLWIFDLLSNELEQITTEHLSINGFDWSNDGNALYYGTNKSGLYKLWEVDLLTKQSRVMPIGDEQLVMPRVAKSGRMVYAKLQDNVNIWSYHLDSKTAKAWRATNDLNLNPSPSPDGSKVCFTTVKDGKFQIWTSNTDGKEAVPITNFIGNYLSNPRWSPDGKYIIFQGFVEGQTDIYKVNALGGIPQNLTNSIADDHTPFYSNNGEIYFSSNQSGEWGIWKMEADGADQIQLVGDNAYAPQVNTDETTLFYSKKEQIGLFAYDLAKQEERRVLELFHPVYWGAFVVAEKGIYYLNAKDGQFDYFDFATQRSNLIYKPTARIPRMGIILNFFPAQQKILFTQIDHGDADIMLLEGEE